MRLHGAAGWRAISLGVLAVTTVVCSAKPAGTAPTSGGSAPPPAVAVRQPAEPFARTPVLLVHGLGSSSAALQPLLDHLAGASHPPDYLLALDIVPNNSPNARAAEQFVAPAVEELLRNAAAAAGRAGYAGPRPTKVDIVAHSMGALSSWWYATRIRPDRVRTWVSVTGANHGAEFGCNVSEEAAQELCPALRSNPVQQSLLDKLNGTPSAPVDESPFGPGRDRPGVAAVPPAPDRSITYFTVRIADDLVILPGESALLDGAGGIPVTLPAGVAVAEPSPGNYLFTQPTDHDAVLNDTGLHLLISALLEAG